MIPVFTAAQAREADRRAVERGVPSAELMQRAAQAVYEYLAPRITARDKVFIACGSGNNGGDGLCLAAILAENGNTPVVWCPQVRTPDAERYLARCKELGVRFLSTPNLSDCAAAVDAIFGTGLSREPCGEYLEAIRALNAGSCYKLAVDVPSGLHADTGRVLGEAVRCDATVTFAGYKYGLLLEDGPDYAGEIAVRDIGLDAPGDCGRVWGEEACRAAFPKRKRNTHKGSYGRCLILAGSRQYFGAGVIAARAALAAGCGYCYHACPRGISDLYRVSTPEVIVEELPEDDGGLRFDAPALDRLLARADAAAMGMGMGVSREVYRTAERLLSGEKPLLVDADGLNSLAKFGLEPLEKASCPVLLTPHPGEFARLTGGCAPGVDAARRFAGQYRVTLLLKGASTIVTDGERVTINRAGSPALAKGGSGDALSGILAALLARGIPPYEAASAGSYLAGKCGETAAEELSEYSPLASDVVRMIPKVLLSLGKNPKTGV